jgi:predicted dehydrogenase
MNMQQSDRILVIGSGSIARRHIANIRELFQNVYIGCISSSGRVLSIDETGADKIYTSIDQAINDTLIWAIVASPSPLHAQHASILLQAGVPVLIEKPLSNSLAAFVEYESIFQHNCNKIDIAYNLRFMPSALRLKALLNEQIVGLIHTVIIDVGQYLPDWRPATDYRRNVSARRSLGGGVLLELSHEFDYLVWFFGQFDRGYCVAGNSGLLEIDVEDRVDILLTRRDGLVANLHMDFLQRHPQRTCKIIGETGTIVWNLLENSIKHYSSEPNFEVIFNDPNYNRNAMYQDELSHFSNLANGVSQPMISIKHAKYILQLIDALRHSASVGQTVTIGDFSR